MPFILIIVGVIAALGLGGFVWNKRAEEVAVQTPVAITEPVTVTPTEPSPEPAPSAATTSTENTPAAAPATTYKDATYTVDVAYNAPDRLSHPVKVSLTLANDVVTASDITFGSEATGATADFQKKFTAAYKSQVVGKPLDSIKLSRVGGASLTTGAWNAAQAKIVAQAKS